MCVFIHRDLCICVSVGVRTSSHPNTQKLNSGMGVFWLQVRGLVVWPSALPHVLQLQERSSHDRISSILETLNISLPTPKPSDLRMFHRPRVFGWLSLLQGYQGMCSDKRAGTSHFSRQLCRFSDVQKTGSRLKNPVVRAHHHVNTPADGRPKAQEQDPDTFLFAAWELRCDPQAPTTWDGWTR